MAVAQPGRAPGCGPGGRGFKSRRSPQCSRAFRRFPLSARTRAIQVQIRCSAEEPFLQALHGLFLEARKNVRVGIHGNPDGRMAETFLDYLGVSALQQ